MNEVQGTVIDQAGKVVHQFGGLWHEGIVCDTLPTPQCIWKPSEYEPSLRMRSFRVTLLRVKDETELFSDPSSVLTTASPACTADPQPSENFAYYGFSRFAMEMNELTPELRPLLPATDTRLRPDQR